MMWMVNDKPIEECKDYIDIACEDAISKKEVFSILTRLMTEAGKDGKLILSDAKEMIGDLPSVAPLRQVGKWIIHCNDIYPEDATQECSLCHAEQRLRWGDDDNFCPNCGADMRGDADEQKTG